ncbi:hypothetical protein Tco_0675552 [Tanacetum coccineum]
MLKRGDRGLEVSGTGLGDLYCFTRGAHRIVGLVYHSESIWLAAVDLLWVIGGLYRRPVWDGGGGGLCTPRHSISCRMDRDSPSHQRYEREMSDMQAGVVSFRELQRKDRQPGQRLGFQITRMLLGISTVTSSDLVILSC